MVPVLNLVFVLIDMVDVIHFLSSTESLFIRFTIAGSVPPVNLGSIIGRLGLIFKLAVIRPLVVHVVGMKVVVIVAVIEIFQAGVFETVAVGVPGGRPGRVTMPMQDILGITAWLIRRRRGSIGKRRWLERE